MIKNENVRMFKKHINVIGIICAIFLTLVTNYALAIIVSNIRNDIMYETLTAILTSFQNALIFVSIYVLYGLLINSLLRFGVKNSRGILSLCFARIGLIYLSYFVFGIFLSKDFINDLKTNLMFILLNLAVDVIMLVGVIILILFLRSKFVDEKKTNITLKSIFEKKNPIVAVTLWVGILISSVYVSGCIAETYANVMTYGANNLNIHEVMTLVTPYIEQIIRFVLGYLVMMGAAKWLELQWSLINSKEARSKK